MGVRYLSYLDIPPGRRAATGSSAVSELQRALRMPGLTPEARQEILTQLERVSGWVNGSLEHVAPEVPHAEVVLPSRPVSEPEITVDLEEEEAVETPRQHVVIVREAFDIDDDR